jgi:hypothetical protein
LTTEPGDSFSALDVLAHCMFLAVVAGFMKGGVPEEKWPSKMEIDRICAHMFAVQGSH